MPEGLLLKPGDCLGHRSEYASAGCEIAGKFLFRSIQAKLVPLNGLTCAVILGAYTFDYTLYFININ